MSTTVGVLPIVAPSPQVQRCWGSCSRFLSFLRPPTRPAQSRLGGNINCNLVPNVMIGTESTTRGTAVEHRLNAPSSAAAKQTVNLGSSSAYAPWGWTFWFQQSGSFIATGYGTYGGVVAGSLNRYCRFN